MGEAPTLALDESWIELSNGLLGVNGRVVANESDDDNAEVSLIKLEERSDAEAANCNEGEAIGVGLGDREGVSVWDGNGVSTGVAGGSLFSWMCEMNPERVATGLGRGGML